MGRSEKSVAVTDDTVMFMAAPRGISRRHEIPRIDSGLSFLSRKATYGFLSRAILPTNVSDTHLREPRFPREY